MELLIGVLGYPYVSSPHWTIFQSPNSTPTLPEASFACSQLMVPKSEIHQINLELASLMMKREHFFKHITNCDAILAPYKKLPSELVSKIFRFIIPPHSAEFPLKRGQQNLRLQITQVCSKWRQIAFGIPLWNLYFRSSSKHTSSIELGASWWSQCSGSLLKLITISPSKPPLIPELDSPLIDKLVLPFSNRLRKLHVSLSTQDLTKIVSVPPGSFNNLEDVVLLLCDPGAVPWAESDSAFLFSPNLCSVSLVLSANPWFTPNLPWGQLTQLTLVTKIPVDACFTILSKCTALASCKFSAIADTDLSSITRANALVPLPLYLPLLNPFTVRFQSGHMSPLLSRLILPNLYKLIIATEITHDHHHWTQGCKEFFKSMETSLHRVEIISLSGQNWLVSLDDTIFSDFPHIRSFLAPPNHHLDPSTMDKMARGEILPKVELLRFYGEDTADVAKMLTARESHALSSDGAISFIRKIKVTCRKSEDAAEERLNDLRSQGMIIEHDVVQNPTTTIEFSEAEPSHRN